MTRILFGCVAVAVAGALLGVTLAGGVLMFGPETILDWWETP